MSDKRDPKFDPDATVTGPVHEPEAEAAKLRIPQVVIDPDATVSGPLFGSDLDRTIALQGLKQDPDTTISGPLFKPDPEQTVGLKPPGPDPEQTVNLKPAGPDLDQTVNLKPAEFDPDVTVSGPIFELDPDKTVSRTEADSDPDATLNRPSRTFDPDATVSAVVPGRRRTNPFAPKALPEELQANLAALGGLNPLIALANPILGVVPEVRLAQHHPDPEILKETLAELVEAFEAGAHSASYTDANVEAAVYALCCLVDDSAAGTPWGRSWRETGLLQKLRGEIEGGEQFFTLLHEMSTDSNSNGDLLEFFYICIVLGYEGRYRGQGRGELDAVRGKLHALIARRRGRPDGLSERWRGAAKAGAQSLVRSKESPQPGPRQAWRAIGAVAIVLVLIYGGYVAFKAPAPVQVTGVAPGALGVGKAGPSPTPATTPQAPLQPKIETVGQTPLSPPASARIESAVPTPVAPPVAPKIAPGDKSAASTLQGLLSQEILRGRVALREDAGGATIAILHERQFVVGGVQPEPPVRAVIEAIGGALEGVQGKILVTGHADSLPVKPQLYASNQELSAARAESVAALLAAKLRQPQRVTAVGAGDRDPIARNDTEESRAKNRRVIIHISTRPAP